MSQASYNVTGGAAPAGSGLNVRLRINQAFSAVMSQNSSDTEPIETVAGMWWWDTLTGFLKQRNVTDDGWNIRWDMTKGQLATLYSPTFAGEVNLPTTTYIGGYPVARTTAPVFTGNSVFETLTAWSSVSLPASTTIGGVSPTELSYLDGVTSAIQTQLNALSSSKQATLVSGTNIKSLNGASLLGSGDIVIDQSPSSVFANSQTFTASGTFTVPAGVTKVMVIAASGAGGGAGGVGSTGVGGTNGGAGGNSSFSSFVFKGTAGGLILASGKLGGYGYGILNNSDGTLGSGTIGGTGGFGTNNSGINGGNGGVGGNTGGGGGGSSFYPPMVFNVIAGSIAVVVGASGAGGAGGSNGTAGGAGGAGKVIVYW